ncbi:MAG: hypothetical protein ABI583_00625 [Betaproteobacteria bacterium]
MPITARNIVLHCFIAITVAPAISLQSAKAELPAQRITAQAVSETPALRERIIGTLVMTEPVGGIRTIDLATMTATSIRPSNVGRSAVHTVSEPDATGDVMFVSGIVSPSRTYTVHMAKSGEEKVLFSGPGDPLWDHAISPISLAPSGGKAAFVAQPPENESERFRQLTAGPLRIWDPATASVRDLGFTAVGERPSWFPDGRMLAYVADAAASTPIDARTKAPEVRLLDTTTALSTPLAPGHLPLVSSDGLTILITRGRNFELLLVDVKTKTERVIPRSHGLGTPIALIDSRYLIYIGKPTPGAPIGQTTNNSPRIGPKPMMAIKLLDLETGQFATLVPLIDPRRSVTALAHAVTSMTPRITR